jgi:GR25 family glycosyltransferase involved in LPS biosynthesis
MWDQAYCISLEEATESRKWVDEDMTFANIPIEHFIAKRHPKGAKYGCYDSHRAVMRKALSEGYQTILVLEDDATLHRNRWTTQVKDELQRIKNQVDFGIMYLGAIPIPFTRYVPIKSFKYIFRSKWMFNWGSHAYVVTKDVMQRIANSEFNGEHYDKFLAGQKGNKDVLVVYPSLIHQSDRDGSGASNTDVLSKTMGMRETQETGTFFSRWWVLTYSLAIVFVFLIILGAWWLFRRNK